jgi:hypothetical protein
MENVIKKLKFKGTGIVINAPTAMENEFVKFGFTTKFNHQGKNGNILHFVNNNKEYLNFLNNSLKNVESDSVLWIAYPKGSSGIKTDINRDKLMQTAEGFGITTVTAIAINETWSALRFRPIERVGK